MANIATTDYILVGERAKEFYDLITELPMHLSKLRDLCGITEAVNCRGELCYAEFDENVYLTTHTAWTACDELFDLIGEKFDLAVNYRECEVGLEIFNTHGDYYPEEIYVCGNGQFFEDEGYYDDVDSAIDNWCTRMNITRDDSITVDYINDYEYSDDDWFHIYYVNFI